MGICVVRLTTNFKIKYDTSLAYNIYTLLCAANFDDMKLRYEAKKKGRINYRFMGFTTFENGWWFNHNTNKWEQNPEAGEKGYSSHQDCKTIKAFRRKLKSAPKGIEFILVSRWVGHNVIGFGCA